MAVSQTDEQRLALFIDFENIAIGVRDAHYRKFDINLVLERLLDKGKLLVKKAYADWSRYSDYKRSFHEAAIELIEVPQKSVGGKNSADIRLVVDAMDMSFQKEHINCFVVASGDSDFSPLVSKLKENNKYVIGLGVKNSTSDLLIENCDEFIFYEDLVRGQQRQMPQIANVNEKLQECFSLLVDSVLALQRENKEVLWGSMVKETMKRKKPSFNETYYGFRTFSHLLEDAQKRGIVELRRDQKSGSYVIEDLGAAGTATGASITPSRVETPGPRGVERNGERTDRERPAAVASTTASPLSSSSERTPERVMAEAALALGGAPGEAAAVPAENGKPVRRRRGRGRGRTRGGVAAAGGPSLVPPGSEEGTDGEFLDHEQDHEEGDDETLGAEDYSAHDRHVAEEHEADSRLGAEGDRQTGHDAGRSDTGETSGSTSAPETASLTAPTPGLPGPDADGAGGADRGPFSFFSWIRREPTIPEPATRRGDEPEE